MLLRTLLFAFFLALVCPVAPLQANETGTDCNRPATNPLPSSGTWSAIVDKVRSLDGPDAHLIDAYFMFDIRTDEKAVNVTAQSYNSASDPGGKRSETVANLFNAWKNPAYSTFGGADKLGPQNTAEYLALLKSQAGALDLQSKFLLLSIMGTYLDLCDSGSNAPYTGTPPDRMFRSLRAGTKDCGVCRDAHAYMANVAQALGFVDVGTHTVNWHQQPTDHTGSHDIMHMRDPATGLYYVQNWGTTFNTGQKTLTQAVDVSAAVMGQLAGTSLVESKPGVVHAYQPRVTRWARQTIEDAAKLGGDRSVLTMHIGTNEQTIRFELGTENTKVFALHESYETSNGPYTIDATGVAGQLSGKKEFQSKWISEVGYGANLYGGAMRTSAPFLGTYNAGEGNNGTAVLGFAGLNVNGYARWNTVTAKLEVHGDMMDFTPHGLGSSGIEFQLPPNNAIKASVTYAPKNSPIKVEATRAWQLSVGSVPVQNPVIRTDYDRLSLVIDTRNGANKPYIVTSTGFYAFEGVEGMSAVGIKEHFKAVIPTEKLGEFYVVFDASAIVANRSKDPFYEAPLALSFGAGWTKQIYRSLTLGADVKSGTSQRPFYLFEEPGSVTPEMGKTDGPRVIGNVWLGGKF